MNTPARLALSLCCLAAALSRAYAQSPQNPVIITSAPYIITSGGYYRLGNSINYNANTGTIIQVNASNVTIDFNGFYISGPVGDTTQSVSGVRAFERSNVTLKDGTIAFCYVGVSLQGNNQANTNSVGQRVENMRVTYCLNDGIELFDAPGSRVAFNQISQIGGYTGSTNNNATGINVSGAVQINDNQVNGVTATGNGAARGIYAGNNGTIVVRNSITDCAIGVDRGAYKDNVAVNCATHFSNGTDAGGNY